MAAIQQPDKVLHFLRPGRLVHVLEAAAEGQPVDWGWAIVVCVHRRVAAGGAAAAEPSKNYFLDLLLACAPGSVLSAPPFPSRATGPRIHPPLDSSVLSTAAA